ncbi:shikimate dehydrogenase family protein [Xylophilus sp. ASV27]|uniref:shikimate dehydrogenase family protein n=1 Tax=Xylophilus sp. ASV27 TaxID=2795129 RepID=UPI0018EC7DD3|nr:shikimate dehydrogenase [Xylophilus sp. ASV27]
MRIDGATRVVGIVADPIAHVRTPQLFNAAAARQGLNAVCVPLHAAPAQLPQLLAGLAGCQNLAGLVVTMPHKEAVVALCGELTPAARLVGAANTLRWDAAQGHWVGGNLDGEGFVAGLKECGHLLAGRRVLLLGAGGAGKAIAYAVGREQPAALVLSNRSMARAEEAVQRLAPALPGVDLRTGAADATRFDVVINATALGLHEGDPAPLPVDTLQPGSLVCEAVMRDTALLAAARERGATAHPGHRMLYGQIVEIARFIGLDIAPGKVPRLFG